jgi:hypothetical protein
VRMTATAGESERKLAAGVERFLIVPSVAGAVPPTGTSPCRHARPVRGRRAADARRNAIGLLDIGATPDAPWSSSTSSRRPVEPGATTRSPCLLHGLLRESWGEPSDRVFARRVSREHHARSAEGCLCREAEVSASAPARRPEQERAA